MSRLIIILLLIPVTIAVEAYSQNKGVESYDNAYRHYSIGDYEKAIRYYDEYLSAYASDAKAYSERGRCFEILNKFDAALADYTSAITLKPNFAQYYRDRGYVYLKTGKPELALYDFNNSVLYDPGNAYGYSARTQAYVKLGNFEFALIDINKAMMFDPANANYLITRATIYSIMDDTLNLYRDIDTILKINPVQFFSSFSTQDVIINYTNINNEITKLSEIILNKPSDDFAYFERGFLYYITSRFGAAEKDFQMCRQCAVNKKDMTGLSERFLENIKKYGDS